MHGTVQSSPRVHCGVGVGVVAFVVAVIVAFVEDVVVGGRVTFVFVVVAVVVVFVVD